MNPQVGDIVEVFVTKVSGFQGSRNQRKTVRGYPVRRGFPPNNSQQNWGFLGPFQSNPVFTLSSDGAF